MEKDDESDIRDGWYLSHFQVLLLGNEQQVRMVFEGASKCNGKSQNDVVYQGPQLHNLGKVLL